MKNLDNNSQSQTQNDIIDDNKTKNDTKSKSKIINIGDNISNVLQKSSNEKSNTEIILENDNHKKDDKLKNNI